MGQALAALVAAMGLATTVLAKGGASLPFLQVAFAGSALVAVYGPRLARDRRARRMAESLEMEKTLDVGVSAHPPTLKENIALLSVPLWRYAVLSALDVAGNYCAVVAYRYTLMTSVTLIGNLSVPLTMGLSWLLLGSRYNAWHCVGSGTALAGTAVLLWADAGGEAGGSPANNPLLGDVVMLAGTGLNAASNVLSEAVLRETHDRDEYLACTSFFAIFLGLLGAFATGELAGGLPPQSSDATLPASTFWLLEAVFALSMLLYYSLAPRMLETAGSVSLNVHLLTTPIWGVLVAAAVHGVDVMSPRVLSLVLVAAALEATGILVYAYLGKDVRSPSIY